MVKKRFVERTSLWYVEYVIGKGVSHLVTRGRFNIAKTIQNLTLRGDLTYLDTVILDNKWISMEEI